MLVVNFDADCVEWAYGFAYAAVGAFLRANVDYWALGFLALSFGLFSCFDGFSGAYGLAYVATHAVRFVQGEFVVFCVQKALYGLLVFVVHFEFFYWHLGARFLVEVFGLLGLEYIYKCKLS